MAKYLDNVGLAYFWQKVKAYVDDHSAAGGGSSVTEYSQVITTSGNTTRSVTITIAGYNASTDVLQVYVNGLKLIKGVEYTANGTTVNLTSGLPANNVIEIVVLKIG